jgi:hypothetical protein
MALPLAQRPPQQVIQDELRRAESFENQMAAGDEEMKQIIRSITKNAGATVGNLLGRVAEGNKDAVEEVVRRMYDAPDRFGGVQAVPGIAARLRLAAPPAQVGKAAGMISQGELGSLIQGQLLGGMARGGDPAEAAQAAAQLLARRIKDMPIVANMGAMDVRQVAQKAVDDVLAKLMVDLEANQVQGGGTDRQAAARMLRELEEKRFDEANREQKGDVNRMRAPMQMDRQALQMDTLAGFMQATGGNAMAAQNMTAASMNLMERGLNQAAAMQQAWNQQWAQLMRIGQQVNGLEQGQRQIQQQLMNANGAMRVQAGNFRAGVR